MNQIALFLMAFGFFCIGQALVTPDFGANEVPAVVKMGSRPTCRAALSECLREIDSGKTKTCETLPVPRRAFLKPIAPGTFELRKLRSGVWMYNDGTYLSLIVLWGQRLVLIDFPDSGASDTDTGSGTRLTDAIEKVLGEKIPTRIDMIYSHAHFDHIGAATRVFNYAKEKFPRAKFVVWGSQETKELIDVHTTNRAVAVTNVVKEKRKKTLNLRGDLKIQMMVVGGHTQQDLVVFIPKSEGQKGIVFYVDVVFPRWSPPFNLAITQDVREMIAAQKKILRLDFDIVVPGHLEPGTKRDIRRNIAYITDLLETGKKVLGSITAEQFVEAGIGKIQDPNAREYRNPFYAFFVARKLQNEACYRAMIEKWGCKLAGLDLFLLGHCFIAVTFVFTDI